jgi:hypothetical protein
MQSVEDVPRWWLVRACGRNPLVRGSDRFELLIVALGILVVLIAAAGAGALGTAVHDARSRVYLEQAQTRHAVIATVIDDGPTIVGVDHHTMTTVNARWDVNGTERTGSLTVERGVETGDLLRIWVDRNGDRVGAPTPASQAGVDAVGVAYAAWQTVALVVAGLICWGRSRLARRRDSAWEREIRCLIEDDDGRTRRKS